MMHAKVPEVLDKLPHSEKDKWNINIVMKILWPLGPPEYISCSPNGSQTTL
jgi:hypothetical protein